MSVRPQNRRIAPWQDERGMTLLETVMAMAILLIVVAGVLSVFDTAISLTWLQGDVATRATEYAQDKMEQLMPLSFNDGSTNTTVFPATPTGGTGLGGAMAASSTVGSIPPAAAVSEYVDYLDGSGNLLTSSTGAAYTRQWSIATDPTATLKTITVVVTSVAPGGPHGAPPSSTLVCIKSNGL